MITLLYHIYELFIIYFDIYIYIYISWLFTAQAPALPALVNKIEGVVKIYLFS